MVYVCVRFVLLRSSAAPLGRGSLCAELVQAKLMQPSVAFGEFQRVGQLPARRDECAALRRKDPRSSSTPLG